MGIETTDLWKLVLERAELTPESEMLVDEQGRRLTFLEYKIASQQMAAAVSYTHLTLPTIYSV